jgi:hypothetical protein
MKRDVREPDTGMEPLGRTRRIALTAGVAAVLFVASAPAQIYKWTDADGIVHYSSTKPATGESFESFRFPCYASDPKCSARMDWEHVPLNTGAFPDIIREVALVHRVDESLIRAIIHAESAYRPDAKSPKGAQGLMQLMPATQAELGVSDPYDPVANIEGGTRYLAQLLARFQGDVELASAAYNAGASAVQRHGGVPPYAETKEYVRRVKILHRRYRQAGA